MAEKTKKRGKYFAFILYPDDDFQVNLLRNLISADRRIPCKMMYILHDEPLNDFGIGKKKHWHVLIAFENARSVDSVQKMLGCLGTVWRLCTMQLTDSVDKLRRREGQVERFRQETWQKVPVLKHPDQPDSFIDLQYNDREFVADVNARYTALTGQVLRDDQAFIRTPLYVVKHVEVVDFQAYALYMIHRTYQCLLDCKKPYKMTDVKGDPDLIFRAFPDYDTLGDGGALSRIYELCGSLPPREVVRVLMDSGDKEAMTFLSGHSTFCRDWFYNKKIKKEG